MHTTILANQIIVIKLLFNSSDVSDFVVLPPIIVFLFFEIISFIKKKFNM